MLMKYTKVKADGTVIQPPSQQLAYGALISGRVAMISDSANISKKALIIAIRYGAVRRQFGGNSDGEPETKLLDYAIHQQRLMPMLARAFAMHFTGIEVSRMYDLLMARLTALKAGDGDMNEVLDSLKELHGTSSGLKAFCTWNALDTIDQCRQALGGHGYSAYAGLASLYNDFAVQCTWEGDNTILTLQSGRYLVGCYRDSLKGRKQAGGVAYLNNLKSLLNAKCTGKTLESVCSLSVITEAFEVVAGRVVQKAGTDFEACLTKGLKEEEAYEQCSQTRLYAAKIHSFGYLFHRFKDGIQSAPPNLLTVLERLCLLNGLSSISQLSGAFLQYQYFTPQQIDWINEKITVLCKQVRMESISLTDAFNYTDFIINSPFGRYDGNVYESYFGMVQKANRPAVIPPYFESEIRPLFTRDVGNADDEYLDLEDDD